MHAHYQNQTDLVKLAAPREAITAGSTSKNDLAVSVPNLQIRGQPCNREKYMSSDRKSRPRELSSVRNGERNGQPEMATTVFETHVVVFFRTLAEKTILRFSNLGGNEHYARNFSVGTDLLVC